MEISVTNCPSELSTAHHRWNRHFDLGSTAPDFSIKASNSYRLCIPENAPA
jgi:hypothetical protein